MLLCLLPSRVLADQSWLVVSDIHLNPFDRSNAPSSYRSDSNWELWRSTLRAMQRADSHPALIVVAGDLLAHGFPALARANGAASDAAAEAAMQRIAQSLAQAFPQAQFLVTLGNNDDPCGDYRTAPGTPYLAALARIWSPLVDENGAAPGFARDFARDGAYSAELPVRSLRAVVLDDVYWSNEYHPCGRVAGNPGRAQLLDLEREVAALPRGMRALVLAHIPPGVDAVSTLFVHRLVVIPFMRADDESALRTALLGEHWRIAFALMGHVHRNDFRLFGGVPILIAPSVSPIYDNNPAFLRLSVASDGTLDDYTLYADDLRTGAWRPIFAFDQYGVGRHFDARTLTAAHARIGRDASARQAWIGAAADDAVGAEVNGATWRTPWCAQMLEGPSFARCAGLRGRLLVLPVIAALLLIVVVASLILIVVRLPVRRAP